jgi:hypothetical protein
MVARAQEEYHKLLTHDFTISAINLQILAFNDHLSALSIFQPNSAFNSIFQQFPPFESILLENPLEGLWKRLVTYMRDQDYD